MYFGSTVYRIANKPSKLDKEEVLTFLKENCEASSINFREARYAFEKTFHESDNSVGFSLVMKGDEGISGVAIINYNEIKSKEETITAFIVPEDCENDKKVAKKLIMETLSYMKSEQLKAKLITHALKHKN